MLVSEPKSAGQSQVTMLPEPTLDVTMVVPYYNPGPRLRRTVEHMVRVLDSSEMTFEIIAVSDGSTDGSHFTLDGFPESVVRRVEFDRNNLRLRIAVGDRPGFPARGGAGIEDAPALAD